jgi:hypothetical protein
VSSAPLGRASPGQCVDPAQHSLIVAGDLSGLPRARPGSGTPTTGSRESRGWGRPLAIFTEMGTVDLATLLATDLRSAKAPRA